MMYCIRTKKTIQQQNFTPVSIEPRTLAKIVVVVVLEQEKI